MKKTISFAAKTFSDEIWVLVEKERVVDIVHLDFTKAFDTLFRKILTERLLKCGLDEQAVRCMEK